MIFRLPILVIFMVLPAAVMANEHASEMHIKLGQTFISARQHIIADGWNPQKFEPIVRFGIERSLYQNGVQEVESCSVDGAGYCIFNYKRNQQCLTLLTAGEQLATMRISSWQIGCHNLKNR